MRLQLSSDTHSYSELQRIVRDKIMYYVSEGFNSLPLNLEIALLHGNTVNFNQITDVLSGSLFNEVIDICTSTGGFEELRQSYHRHGFHDPFVKFRICDNPCRVDTISKIANAKLTRRYELYNTFPVADCEFTGVPYYINGINTNINPVLGRAELCLSFVHQRKQVDEHVRYSTYLASCHMPTFCFFKSNGTRSMSGLRQVSMTNVAKRFSEYYI